MTYFLSLSERDLITRDGNDFYPDCHLFTAGEITKLDFTQKTTFVPVEISMKRVHTAFGVRLPDIDECIVRIEFCGKTVVFGGTFHCITDTIKGIIKLHKEKVEKITIFYEV